MGGTNNDMIRPEEPEPTWRSSYSSLAPHMRHEGNTDYFGSFDANFPDASLSMEMNDDFMSGLLSAPAFGSHPFL